MCLSMSMLICFASPRLKDIEFPLAHFLNCIFSCRLSQLQLQAAVVVLRGTPQTRWLSRHMALRCVERGQRTRKGMAALRHFLWLL